MPRQSGSVTARKFARSSRPIRAYGARAGLSVVLAVATFLGTASVAGAAANDELTPLIVGGTTATIADAPWQVGLISASASSEYQGQFCGGTLIERDWVATAAHCISPTLTPAQLKILVGYDTLRTSGASRAVATSRIVVHPDYDDATKDNDVALIQLASPVTPSAGSIETLPLASATVPAGTSALITGWGNTAYPDESFPTVLRKATVSIVSDAACNIPYGGSIDATNMLCASNAGFTSDTCQGDSGGPLSVQVGSTWTLAGITSFGSGCATSPYPGVYAEVSTYRDWILGYTADPQAFTPMSPARLADTRSSSPSATADGQNPRVGILPAGGVLTVPVLGRVGIPASGVDAVALNVTVTQPGGSGHATVYPAGTSRPNASNLNYSAGQTIPNMVIAKVGSGGSVSVYSTSAAHIIVDVMGYFPTVDGYAPTSPARLADTRSALPTATADGQNPRVGRLTSGGVVAVPVLNRVAIPASGVSAVALNITVTQPGSSGHLTVFPTGTPKPNASNLNYSGGQTIANMVIAKVGTDGSVSIYSTSAAHIIVDVMGYFTADSGYDPLSPARLADTRSAIPAATIDGANPRTTILPAGQVLKIPVRNRGGVAGIDAQAVALNVTVVGPQGGGFLTVYPSGEGRPNTSNLNFSAGQTIPNMVIAKIGSDGTVSIFTSATANIVVDVAGWFAQPVG